MSEKHPLVERLEGLWRDENRAALAALRRALMPGGEASVYPYVAPFFPTRPDARRERALVTLASLFALHPGAGGLTLPRALRRVREAKQSGSMDGRFVALLDAELEDVVEHLRHAVSLIRGAEVPLDWSDLLNALLQWGHEDRWVQRKWARMYWAEDGVDKEDNQS